MIADSRAKMNKFVMRISDLVVNECKSSMLIPCMDSSPLMVHAEQIEEKNLKQVCRELKKVKTKEGNISKNRFEFQYKPIFKRRLSNQALLILQGLKRLRCVPPSPKRGRMEDLMLRSLFVQNVRRDMMVSA